jgi:beta-1,4-N-acetylglucosaminyltransferase
MTGIGGKLCFVTVGTTEFDVLIRTVDCAAFYNSLLKLGFERIVMQIGRGAYVPFGGEHGASVSKSDATVSSDVTSTSVHCWPRDADTSTRQRLRIEVYRYRASISEELRTADLVISHCGAGTCIETLEAHHALLIVVINETLMHNHQTELAAQLAADRYCVATRCGDLLTLLNSRIDFAAHRVGDTQIVAYPPGEPTRFARFLDAVTAGTD